MDKPLKRSRRNSSKGRNTPNTSQKLARVEEPSPAPSNVSLFSPISNTPRIQEQEENGGSSSSNSGSRGVLLPKMVCWANWEEWKEVKRCLFSSSSSLLSSSSSSSSTNLISFSSSSLINSNKQEVEKGLQRIHTWKLRQHLPLSIDITANLIELQTSVNLGSDISRLAYAMALVRMVNGLVDSQQTKLFAMSVSRLAIQLGLPRCLVEVRHEATHKQLPSLPMLQYAADEALLWLKENYWEEQEKRIGFGVDMIQLCLQRYKKAMEKKEIKRATTQLKMLLGFDIMCVKTELLPCLASFLCSSPSSSPRSFSDSSSSSSSSSLDARMSTAHHTWDHALNFLQTHYPSLSSSLILVLVQALCAPEVQNHEMITRWVLFLLQKTDNNTNNNNNSLDTAALVQMCLSSKKQDCLTILKGLPLSPSIRAKVEQLLQIEHPASAASSSSSAGSGPDINTLETLYITAAAKEDWSDCPLGLLPNGQTRNADTSLLLENEPTQQDLLNHQQPQQYLLLQDNASEEEMQLTDQQQSVLAEFPAVTKRIWQADTIKALQMAIEIW